MPSIVHYLSNARNPEIELMPPAYYFVGNWGGIVGIILTSCGILTIAVQKKQHKLAEKKA